MSRFIQLHLLTSYPPSNLNRDDLGRPKTAVMGGVSRLRVSSQSLKRAWRTSEGFTQALAGTIGTRTKNQGVRIYTDLLAGGASKKAAKEWAQAIAKQFGALKKASKEEGKELQDLEIEQLAHFSPEEISRIDSLVSQCIERNSAPSDDDLALLTKQHKAVDVALFGRMLASSPAFNCEAACQVAHAITVHKTQVEDDFFTAVDDLNSSEEDLGAGHMGETEFAAGLFYLYICIDRELLLNNLQGDQGLTGKTLKALITAATTVAPTGKQNSFASRARASYVLAEKGDQQPRSLSVAYLKAVSGTNMAETAIDSLTEQRDNMEKVYGPCADKYIVMDAYRGEGSLDALCEFVSAA